MSWRDRFSELKDSVDEWRDGSADRSFDSQVEKHLTTLKSGSEQARAAAVKALLVQVQAAERWRAPIVKALLGTSRSSRRRRSSRLSRRCGSCAS